jgi:16S rRNA (uracil1498-N3)-methyltransferase
LRGEDVKHARDVLRLLPADLIIVSDGSGTDFVARVEAIGEKEITATILEEKKRAEVGPRVWLFQGFAKGAKMDLIVRQATEIGVSQLVPVFTERSVVHLGPEERKRRVARWQKIAVEASKQSQRSYLPKIHEPKNWQEAISLLGDFDLVVVPWEEERERSLKNTLKAYSRKWERVAVVIGPEGGFTRAEVSELDNLGGVPVSLGQNVLRTETASLVALAILFYELGQ